MKLRSSIFSICVMLLLAGAVFTSCTQTDTPGDTKYSDTYTDVTGLTNGTSYQFSVSATSANTVITGVSSWQSQTVRVFWSRAAGDSSKVTVTATPGTTPGSGVIVWAPAVSGGTFRLYETSDLRAGHPSGLVLGPTPAVLSVGDASAASTIDVVLATDNTLPVVPYLSFISPDVAGSRVTGSTRSTKFSSSPASYLVTGGLAMQSMSADFSSLVSGTRNYVDVDATTASGASQIFLAKTIDNHYSRVEVLPNTAQGNHFWGDTDPGVPATSRRFVDVNVTYQPKVGVGN